MPPPVFFSYLLFNETRPSFIGIDSLNSRVIELKNVIFRDNEGLRVNELKSSHLWLYLCNSETYQLVSEYDVANSQEMDDLASLSEYFPNTPPGRGPHIVVKFPLPLCCLLYGYSEVKPFLIKANYLVATSTSIQHQIKDAFKHRLGRYDAADLELWKVSIPCNANLNDIHESFEFKEGMVLGELSATFKEPPKWGHIHLIVRVPATISPSSSNKSNVIVPAISPYWSPRRKIVHHLYQTLLNEGLVMVRGTPGCGKTALLNLLHAHILECSPSPSVYTQRSWVSVPNADARSERALNKRLKELDPKYPRSKGITFLLFDEAQDTYQDQFLWSKFFQGVSDGLYFQYRVVLFCSYGTPGSCPVFHDIGAPLALRDAARISLRCSPESGSIGLLLTRFEFDEIVTRYQYPLDLHPDLLDLIFDWTAGHVGAVTQMLHVILRQKVSSTQHKLPMTVDDFYAQNPIHQLVRTLRGGDFERGLPKDTELSAQPDVAELFRNLLTNGLDIRRGVEDEAIRKCHHHGWIYPYRTPNKLITRYVFPSPLHAACLSWRLEPRGYMPHFTSLFDLALEAISNFKPSRLKIPIRSVDPMLTDKQPEAQYKDEFYRSMFSITLGNVRISPEFASAKRAHVAGRIDFFIPAMDWGIELTREGSQLTEYDSRLSKSEVYGVASPELCHMDDYILLDCRTSPPQKPFPSIVKLFHVVFQDDYRKVVVYDNMAKPVKGPIALIENN